MNIMDTVEKKHMKKDIPSFEVGDTVNVHVLIREGEKERIQVFKGDVIARKGTGLSETFTVRKISFGIGVERVFPLHSVLVKKVERLRKGRSRRSKLYYLRKLKGKAARLREVR